MAFEAVLNFFATIWSCIRGEDDSGRGDRSRKSRSRKSRREQAAAGEEALNTGTANDQQTPQGRNLTAIEKHLERLREPDKSLSSKKKRRNKAPDGSRESDDSWKKDEAARGDGNKQSVSAWSGDFADCSLLAQIFLDDTTCDGQSTAASSETRDILTPGSGKTPGKSQEENASGREGVPTREAGTTCGSAPPVETARPKETSGRREKIQTLGSDVNGNVAEKTQQNRETGSLWRKLLFKRSAQEEGTEARRKSADLGSAAPGEHHPACAGDQNLGRAEGNQSQNRARKGQSKDSSPDHMGQSREPGNQSQSRPQNHQGQNSAPDHPGRNRAQNTLGQNRAKEGVKRLERADEDAKRYSKSVVMPRRAVDEQETGLRGAALHCRDVRAAGQEEGASPEVLKNPSHNSASPEWLLPEWRTALREAEKVLAPAVTPWFTNRKECEVGSLKSVHFDDVVPPNKGSVKIITPTWTPRHLVEVKPHQRRSKKVFLLPPIKEESGSTQPPSEAESAGPTKQRGQVKTKKKPRASRGPSRQELAGVGARPPPKGPHKTSAPVSILGDTPTLASDERELVQAARLAHNSNAEFPVRAVQTPEREDVLCEKAVVELGRSRSCCALMEPNTEERPAPGTSEEDSPVLQIFSVPDLGDASCEKVSMLSTNDEPCTVQTSCPLPPIPSCVGSPSGSVCDLPPKKNEPVETETDCHAKGLLTTEQPLALRCEPTSIFSLDYLAAGRDLNNQGNASGTWQDHGANNRADQEAGASNMPGDPTLTSDGNRIADTTREARKRSKKRRRRKKEKRSKVHPELDAAAKSPTPGQHSPSAPQDWSIFHTINSPSASEEGAPTPQQSQEHHPGAHQAAVDNHKLPQIRWWLQRKNNLVAAPDIEVTGEALSEVQSLWSAELEDKMATDVELLDVHTTDKHQEQTFEFQRRVKPATDWRERTNPHVSQRMPTLNTTPGHRVQLLGNPHPPTWSNAQKNPRARRYLAPDKQAARDREALMEKVLPHRVTRDELRLPDVNAERPLSPRTQRLVEELPCGVQYVPPPLPRKKPEQPSQRASDQDNLPGLQSSVCQTSGRNTRLWHGRDHRAARMGDHRVGTETWRTEQSPAASPSDERPLTAQRPPYPEHWGEIPSYRPPGRGGQGFGLGIMRDPDDRDPLFCSSPDGDSPARLEVAQLARNTAAASCARGPPAQQADVYLPRLQEISGLSPSGDMWCRLSVLPYAGKVRISENVGPPMNNRNNTKKNTECVVTDFEDNPEAV